MTRYLFRLMGPPCLCGIDAAGTVTPIRLSRSNLALLALVTMNGRGAMLSRERAADTLWPDAARDKATSRLSSTLLRLRRALGSGAGAIATDEGRIGLAATGTLDVDVLDLAACTARLRQSELPEWRKPDVAALEAAINLRRGGFLEGLDGDWVLAARQRCADIYEAGLEALIRYHRHCGHTSRSIDAARTLVRQDPYREDIQAVLVELYARKGQRRRALAQYTACRDLLKEDLGVEPGPEMAASLRTALRPRAASATDPALLAAMRSIDSSIEKLARQVGEIHALLNGSGGGGSK